MISNKTNQAMIQEILEDIAAQGINQLKDSLERLFNQLMIAEREDHIGAGPYERSPDRSDHSNGFKNKTLVTRSGTLNLKIPQVRSGTFYPSCFEKGEKVEQALSSHLQKLM